MIEMFFLLDKINSLIISGCNRINGEIEKECLDVDRSTRTAAPIL